VPRATVDPRATGITARSGGESIVRTAVSGPLDANVITVTADNVAIEGFDIQGSNSLLPASGQTSNGVQIQAARGIANGTDGGGWTPVNHLIVSNNIFQDFGRFWRWPIRWLDQPRSVAKMLSIKT